MNQKRFDVFYFNKYNINKYLNTPEKCVDISVA